MAEPLYLQIHVNRVVLRSLGKNPTTVQVHAERPFTSQRLLVGHFSEAEHAVKDAIQQLLAGRWLASVSVLIIQPMEMVEGGLSQVEERLLLDLGASAGARRVRLWTGDELSDQEALTLAAG